MSNSLWPHGLKHARLLCSPLSPRACSNSCPLSPWCHPTISSSVVPFFCSQSFPASGSFPVTQLFTSRGQSTGASASASVLPMNIQGWFPLGLTGLNFWSPRDSQGSSPAPQFETISSSALSFEGQSQYLESERWCLHQTLSPGVTDCPWQAWGLCAGLTWVLYMPWV